MALTAQPTKSASRPAAARRGRAVVVILVGLGLLAGLISISYWTWMAKRAPIQQQAPASSAPPHQSPQQSPQPSAGSAAGPARYDVARADRELRLVQERFLETLQHQSGIPRVMQAGMQFVQRYPHHAAGYVVLGEILLEAGRLADAQQHFERSLELEPQQPEVCRLAGNIALMLRRYEQAVDHYARAVALEPGHAESRLHLAQAYLSLGQDELARQALEAALRVDSTLHRAYSGLSDVHAGQGDLDQALVQITRAIEQTPVAERKVQAIYLRKKARLLRLDNQPRESLLTLQRLTLAEQRDPAVLEEMALSWSMMGEPIKAAELYEQALASSPMDWQLAAGAAQWRIEAGDHEAARAHLQHLQRIDPGLPAVQAITSQL